MWVGWGARDRGVQSDKGDCSGGRHLADNVKATALLRLASTLGGHQWAAAGAAGAAAASRRYRQPRSIAGGARQPSSRHCDGLSLVALNSKTQRRGCSRNRWSGQEAPEDPLGSLDPGQPTMEGPQNPPAGLTRSFSLAPHACLQGKRSGLSGPARAPSGGVAAGRQVSLGRLCMHTMAAGTLAQSPRACLGGRAEARGGPQGGPAAWLGVWIMPEGVPADTPTPFRGWPFGVDWCAGRGPRARRLLPSDLPVPNPHCPRY